MLNHKGFDLWADGYDKSVGLSDEANTYPFAGYKKVLAAIFQTVMQTPNASVLDIGFGTAVLTARLYEQGCTIYGQDFSSRMLELASEKMPDAQLYQGDFTTGLVEPLRDRRYDYIVATYSLHHLTDAQKVVFLSALRGCLNENGRLFLNADAGFDCVPLRSVLKTYGIVANICINKRNGTGNDSIVLDELLYRERYYIERTNVWIDSYRTILNRFDTTLRNWESWNYIAFSVMLLRKCVRKRKV